MLSKNDKILILGSNGMVGSAIVRKLKKLGFVNLLTPKRAELNLLSQHETVDYFLKYTPHVAFLAAAKVGGIIANNTYRADFLFENLSIQNHVFEGAFKSGVEKLLFLGSSCIYPRDCEQPIKEEYLLTGVLEPTNEPYAIAKIAGLKMAENYRRQYGKLYYSVMPTNLYGENDNYHLENSHVIPGLIARMHQAKMNGDKKFKVWGSGKPRREFLYVDDMARGCIHYMNLIGEKEDLASFINLGTGEDIEIGELAQMIKQTVGFEGNLVFDTSKPDGMMRKLLDVSKAQDLGWKPEVNLEDGLKKSVEFYLAGLN